MLANPIAQHASALAAGANSAASGATLIEAYGTVLALQPDLSALKKLNIDAEAHLVAARKHLMEWTGVNNGGVGLKSRLQDSIDGIINWAGDFAAYWRGSGGFDAQVAIIQDSSSSAADKNQALTTIATGLATLRNSINTFDQGALALSADFSTFAQEVAADHAAFGADVAAYVKENDDKTSTLATLKAKLDEVNSKVNKDIAVIATSVVVLVGTAGAMGYACYIEYDFDWAAPVLLGVGLGVIGTALYEIVERSGELHSLQEQKGDLQAQLDSIKTAIQASSQLASNLDSLSDASGSAESGCKQISAAWAILEKDLQDVIADCQQGFGAGTQAILAWLLQAKSDWAMALVACQKLKNLGIQMQGVSTSGNVTMTPTQMIAAIGASAKTSQLGGNYGEARPAQLILEEAFA
jgi:hemolytic enterotoxin HBL